MQKLYILQGHPGSGKSTYAKELMSKLEKVVIVSADYHFIGEDEIYRFNPKEIGLAHQNAQDSARHWLDCGYSVIVDNTNTQHWEAKPYVSYAHERGIPVEFIRLEGDYPNIHGVPEQKVKEMKGRMQELTLETVLKSESPKRK